MSILSTTKKDVSTSKLDIPTSTDLSTNFIDSLENEFDRTFIELDTLFSDMDVDQLELMSECRARLTRISGIIANFVLKSQLILQKNKSLEDELQEIKKSLAKQITINEVLNKEADFLLLKIHKLQCQQLHHSPAIIKSRNDFFEARHEAAPHEAEMIKKRLVCFCYNIFFTFLIKSKVVIANSYF